MNDCYVFLGINNNNNGVYHLPIGYSNDILSQRRGGTWHIALKDIALNLKVISDAPLHAIIGCGSMSRLCC